ncbi:MAG: hypothetical protein ABIM60_05635 [candidate division WOR-3 bacterium]
MKLFLLFLIVQNPINFWKEEIKIEIQNKTLKVRGIYYFKNLSNFYTSIIMRYPFPVDEYHEYPFYVKIKGFVFKREGNDLIMPVNFKPFEEKKIEVIYAQRLKDKKAKYILTTTQKWGKPLESAYFEIKVPLFFKDVKISYKPDSVKIKKNFKFFYIHRKNFLPKDDLFIDWK